MLVTGDDSIWCYIGMKCETCVATQDYSNSASASITSLNFLTPKHSKNWELGEWGYVYATIDLGRDSHQATHNSIHVCCCLPIFYL